VLKQVFGQETLCAVQRPVPNPCADFDANPTVSPNDFSLLKQNFGLVGPSPPETIVSRLRPRSVD